MDNTIRYKNRVYRCRDESIKPLNIYPNKKNKGYLYVVYEINGAVEVEELNLDLRYSSEHTDPLDLIEVIDKKPANEVLMDMVREGKKVLILKRRFCNDLDVALASNRTELNYHEGNSYRILQSDEVRELLENTLRLEELISG